MPSPKRALTALLLAALVACAAGTPDRSTRESGLTATPASTSARDWSRFPPIVEADGVDEMWIVSDVHGDYGAFTKLLAHGNVIAGVPATSGAVQWTAGHAALVVVGDVIDKGPDALDVVRLLSALGPAAAAAGGRVIVTMGNHEAEFLADPTNDKASGSDGIDHELASTAFTPAQTAAGQGEIGAFLRDLPFAARVGDWFFVHAGKTDGKTIVQLSGELQSGVDQAGFGAPVLSAPDSLLEARLGKTSPQWWDVSGDPVALLGQWTAALGVHHLVMGHQPGAVAFADGSMRPADQLFQAFGGQLFLLDTGMSVDVDHTGGAFLHVTGSTWQVVPAR